MATAAETGCPPNVYPWPKLVDPVANGSNTRSETRHAPIGE